MYPVNPQVTFGFINMGYVSDSDTTRTRTRNLFRLKRAPFPLYMPQWRAEFWKVSFFLIFLSFFIIFHSFFLSNVTKAAKRSQNNKRKGFETKSQVA